LLESSGDTHVEMFEILNHFLESLCDLGEDVKCTVPIYGVHHVDGLRRSADLQKTCETTRAGFKGGSGGQGPRPPTNRGPPTKPFILQAGLHALFCYLLVFHF